MSKDPFQILADELTLIRKDMDKLQRTSLDKQEAEALHKTLAQAVGRMDRAAQDVPQTLKGALKADRDQMIRNATEAATRAAQGVMSEIRHDLDNERAKLSQAAGEARREVWRWFGGFWVWLASVGAAGALLGALAAFWIGGTIAARDFGDHPGIFCGGAGGQVVKQNDGSSYCAVWIKMPPERGN